ncbi:MAG: hypothetical protein OCC49_04490 [Fibrobacterales bacterium]
MDIVLGTLQTDSVFVEIFIDGIIVNDSDVAVNFSIDLTTVTVQSKLGEQITINYICYNKGILIARNSETTIVSQTDKLITVPDTKASTFYAGNDTTLFVGEDYQADIQWNDDSPSVTILTQFDPDIGFQAYHSYRYLSVGNYTVIAQANDGQHTLLDTLNITVIKHDYEKYSSVNNEFVFSSSSNIEISSSLAVLPHEPSSSIILLISSSSKLGDKIRSSSSVVLILSSSTTLSSSTKVLSSSSYIVDYSSNLSSSIYESSSVGLNDPQIVMLAPSNISKIPVGLKVSCTGNCPVLQAYGYHYWPLSYIDNRVSLGIVKFDTLGNYIGFKEHSGTRYVETGNLDDQNINITFTGQSNKSVSIALAELESIVSTESRPKVELIAKGLIPTIPAGLKVSCFSDASTNSSNTCPVVKWNGISYWALSYFDNRSSLSIVGFDMNGTVLTQKEIIGTRYVWTAIINESDSTITFKGQGSGMINIAWNQLGSIDNVISPTISMVNGSSAPAIPAGSKITCFDGPNSFTSSPCPVVSYENSTYWAYSYLDNRSALNIVKYDINNIIIGQKEITGVRYIWEIEIDTITKQLTFKGQGGGTGKVLFSELSAM